MINALLVILCTLSALYFLFLKNKNLKNTINPTRWMLFTWIILLSVAITTPIRFHSYTINFAVMAYSVAWILCFILGQKLGSKLRTKRTFGQKRISDSVDNFLLILSTLGCIGLTIVNWSTILEVMRNPFAVALRREYFTYESEGYFVTIATFLALGGLNVSLYEFIDAIAQNRTIRAKAYLGIIQYSYVYVLGAGRQGFAILLVALIVSIAAAMHISKYRYRHWSSMIFATSLILTIGVVYNLFIVIYRSTGATGSIEWKMEYSNRLYDATVDERFRDSVLGAGPIGMLTTEFFYYSSPQLYGLSYTMDKYSGAHAYGAVQFPYIARRIEYIFNKKLLTPIETDYEKMYDSQGLFGHFFRTAIENTYLDYGYLGGAIFIFICGFGAGIIYMATLNRPSPELLCLIAMICAGASFTVVFSPFAETGYAFPMLWFFVRIPFRNI